MSDGAFREANEVSSAKEQAVSQDAEPKNPDIPTDGLSKEVEAPISHYVEINGYPYTAEYFDVVNIYDKPDIEMYDEIMDIEDAYIKKVSAGEYEDSKETFKKFIEEAENATDCKYAPKEIKIAKIAEWVKFMSKLNKIEKENINGKSIDTE
jgi:hypothetical protein